MLNYQRDPKGSSFAFLMFQGESSFIRRGWTSRGQSSVLFWHLKPYSSHPLMFNPKTWDFNLSFLSISGIYILKMSSIFPVVMDLQKATSSGYKIMHTLYHGAARLCDIVLLQGQGFDLLLVPWREKPDMPTFFRWETVENIGNQPHLSTF